MKILFLDDNPARHALMDKRHPDDCIIHCDTIWKFVDQLRALNDIDIISLDYDLNNFTDLGIASCEGYTEMTGLDACGYMVRHRDKLPKDILIHSSNGTGAKLMGDFLTSKGIASRWKMFDDTE
jgi:hypothetical protein